jgi:hypothetical protein
MKTVIANLDNDWKLSGEEIDAFRPQQGMKTTSHPGRNS